MSPAEFNVLHILHLTSAFMLIGLTFYAFAADPSRRKVTLAWGGIGSLLVLLTGIRMWQGQFNFTIAGWIIVKLVCWLAITAFTGIGFRRRGAVGILAVLTLLLAGTAVAVAYLKPF